MRFHFNSNYFLIIFKSLVLLRSSYSRGSNLHFSNLDSLFIIKSTLILLLQFSVSFLFDNEQLLIQVCFEGMLLHPLHRILNALSTRSFWKLHKQWFFRYILCKFHIDQLLYNVLLHIRCSKLFLALRILCCFQLGLFLFVLFLLQLFGKSQ